MNGEELYQWIKECLSVFDLEWNEKEKMNVSASDSELHIDCGNIRMTKIFKKEEYGSKI